MLRQLWSDYECIVIDPFNQVFIGDLVVFLIMVKILVLVSMDLPLHLNLVSMW